MPNPNQIGNSDSTQNAESTFTKMANEAPSFEEHIKQYKAEHPDAVEDIEKARVMAEAGNRLETKAAMEKLNALKAIDNNTTVYESTNLANNKDILVKDQDGENFVRYDDLRGDKKGQAVFANAEGNRIYYKPVQQAPENIKALKELAFDVEERAGEHYDEMQQLRKDIKNS